MITPDPSTWPSGDQIWVVAQAIAKQEGYRDPGNAPFRYNNPGDLSKGDEHGQPVQAYTRLPDGENLMVFSSPEAGWNALYAKLSNILTGRSSMYTPQMTWRQIGYKWASDPNWANGVAGFLGVDPNSIFANFFLNAPQVQPPAPIDPGPAQVIPPDPGIQSADLPPAAPSDAPGGQIPGWVWVVGIAVGVLALSDLLD